MGSLFPPKEKQKMAGFGRAYNIAVLHSVCLFRSILIYQLQSKVNLKCPSPNLSTDHRLYFARCISQTVLFVEIDENWKNISWPENQIQPTNQELFSRNDLRPEQGVLAVKLPFYVVKPGFQTHPNAIPNCFLYSEWIPITSPLLSQGCLHHVPSCLLQCEHG